MTWTPKFLILAWPELLGEMHQKQIQIGLLEHSKHDSSLSTAFFFNLVNWTFYYGCSGYMPPEYAMEGIFSVKSDVYSFGVLLLEIVSGRKNKSFHHNHGAFAINLAGYVSLLYLIFVSTLLSTTPGVSFQNFHTNLVSKCTGNRLGSYGKKVLAWS